MSNKNPNSNITISYLKMVAKALGWLMLEAIAMTTHEHVDVCSDNLLTKASKIRGASKTSMVVNRLLQVLVIR